MRRPKPADTAERSVRRFVPNTPVKRVPLDAWVNDNSPARSAEYASGYWQFVEFSRRLAFKFEAQAIFAVGTHRVFTPPPKEELVVPIVCLEFDQASVVLEHDFAEWPDEWRIGVKLTRPYQSETLNLFDPTVSAGRDGDAIEELGFPAFSTNQRGFSCRLRDEWDVATFVRLLLADGSRR